MEIPAAIFAPQESHRQDPANGLSSEQQNPCPSSSSSINAILREHCRQRLYVQPLHWTSLHLRLLKCAFTFASRTARDGEDQERQSNDNGQSTAAINDISNLLPITPRDFIIGRSRDIQTAVSIALRRHGLYKASNPHLMLTFSKRPVRFLATECLFASSPTGPATLAFIDFASLALRRRRSFGPCRGGRASSPVARIRMKKEAKVRPTNMLHDPYIAAVLITMAQQQQRYLAMMAHEAANSAVSLVDVSGKQVLPRAEGSSSTKVYLLAATDVALYYYTAQVPLSFLDRFDSPSLDSTAEQVSLKYRRIPVMKPRVFDQAMQKIAERAGVAKQETKMHEDSGPAAAWNVTVG